jgi:hypothetical protein
MKDKCVGNEKPWTKNDGCQNNDQPRYKIILVRGADLLYDTLTNTYYKQFRLPFEEGGDA